MAKQNSGANMNISRKKSI